jgi:hypothetical protein
MARLMHSVTFHVDGGIRASRAVLAGRLILALPLLFLMGVYGLWQLVLWPFRALGLLLMGERDTRAWEQSRRIVEFCANFTAFLLLLSDRLPMGAVRVRLAYSPLVSKFEMLMRPPFGFLLFFNSVCLGILAAPFWLLQFGHILLFGRRHPAFHRLLLAYLSFLIDVRAYFFFGVEDRPSLMPEHLQSLVRRCFCRTGANPNL